MAFSSAALVAAWCNGAAEEAVGKVNKLGDFFLFFSEAMSILAHNTARSTKLI